jgi:hypothetical protein
MDPKWILWRKNALPFLTSYESNVIVIFYILRILPTAMVFTAGQITAFFESPDQMAIPHRTRVKLVEEGIVHPSDLRLFKAEGFKRLAGSLRHPGGTVANPDPNAAVGALVTTPIYVMGAKSWLRLEAAAELVRYYHSCNRPLTAANMQWEPTISFYSEYWGLLEAQLKDTPPVLPKITKALPIMKWAEAFDTYLSRLHGARSAPLTYVTRDSEAVDDPLPALVAGKPYSAKYKTPEDELVALTTHDSGLFRIDNSKVYYELHQATQGTTYAASVTPFAASKDGRGAYLALTSQFAGPDKWQELLRTNKEFLQNRKWNGQTQMTLETFIGQHRQSHVVMTQCKRHVHVELPSDYSRVTALLDSIECDNSRLQAALSQVRTDETDDGPRHSFSKAVNIILPQDPVALKRTKGKRPAALISGLDVSGPGNGHLKVGKGKTGVDLRWHKPPDYAKLSKPQQDELREVRDARFAAGLGRNLPGAGPPKSDRQGKHKKSKKPDKGQSNAELAALISAAVVAGQKETTKPDAKVSFSDTELKKMKALISSMEADRAPTDEPDSSTAVASATAAVPGVILQGIIKKAKRG